MLRFFDECGRTRSPTFIQGGPFGYIRPLFWDWPKNETDTDLDFTLSKCSYGGDVVEKRSLSYLIGTFIFLTVCGLTPALAQRRASPINLRGTYAVKSVGIATECTNIGGCDAASPTPEPRNFGAVAVAAFDENGNFCGSATATSSPTAGSPLPVEVTTRIVTGGLSSFDPIRAEGEVNFSVYEGGSCDRVVFESAGATLTTTGTAHVVVSDSGDRIDGVIDTYIGTADQFGSVLVNLTLIKQFPGDDPSPRARKDLSLADLAGAFSAKSDGTEALCTNSGGCDAASPTLVPLKFTADAHGTLDEAGRYCAIAGSASSPTVGSALAA